MRKNKYLIILPIIACSLSSCGNSGPINPPKLSTIFKPKAYNDTIYVIDRSAMSFDEANMIVSLQGIVAQSKSSIFIKGMGEKESTLTDMQEKFGFTLVDVENPWDLVDTFKDKIINKKYVMYKSAEKDKYDLSINRAATIGGVEGWISIEEDMVTDALNHGLKFGADATTMSDRDVFYNYKNYLDNSYMVNQDPKKIELRDYAIAGHCLSTYVDYLDDNLRKEISSWTKENCPVFGWTENETDYVSYNSLFSMVTVASDWSANLSFMATEHLLEDLKSNGETQKLTAEEGKHYVTIVMSDGDNIQWMQRGFEYDSRWYGSKHRGEFKMNWTVAPTLYDVVPSVMTSIYETSTANDCFIAGPSGFGYVNVNEYNENSIASYAALTASYCQKSNLKVLNFIDNFIDTSYLGNFTQYSNIKGGLWSVSNKYISAGDYSAGGVYWSNGKPFVTFRETLWRASGDPQNKYFGFTERVAQRINDRSTDVHSIDAYTAVVCHAWSIGTMEYINRFVQQLDPHVEIVNAEEFIQLITDNVPHQNVEEVYDCNIADYEDKDLCPIDTVPFYWKDVKNIPETPNRSWDFTTPQDDWHLDCGGLQYDTAEWTSEGIKLDGSDLDDRVDAIPNAYAYSMVRLTNEENISMVVKSGTDSDVNFRVRLYVENSQERYGAKSYNLKADGWSALDENGYYLFTSNDFITLNFDISSIISEISGKKATLVLETDDSGEGSGEMIYCKSLSIN